MYTNGEYTARVIFIVKRSKCLPTISLLVEEGTIRIVERTNSELCEFSSDRQFIC